MQSVAAVQFDVPRLEFACLKQLKGLETFDLGCETLTILKPIDGLNDAPRAWRTTLHRVLKDWPSCRQLYSGRELYCVHKRNQRSIKHIVARAG